MGIACLIFFGFVCFMLGTIYEETVVITELEYLFKDDNGKEKNEEEGKEKNNGEKGHEKNNPSCRGCLHGHN